MNNGPATSPDSVQSISTQKLKMLRQVLRERSFPSIEEAYALDELADSSDDFSTLYSELVTLREILQKFAQGDFERDVPFRGAVAGSLKALQANLRHLAWQVEQVACGDFSQHVDFMGNLSTAFNSLTAQLEAFVAEQKEREALERIQIMLDAMPLCCTFWDENMTNIDCNLEALKLFELETKQEYLERFWELSPEIQANGRLSKEYSMDRIREAFEKGRCTFAWLHQTLDGEPIPSEITLVRVWQKDHYIVVGYTRDLRELKETQNALERERLLLLDILNTSPICFAIVIDDVVKFVNPFMQQFFGISLGEELSAYLYNQSTSSQLNDPLEKDYMINWRSVTMRTKHGEIKEMLSNAFPVNYFDEQGVMIWLVDITQIRKIEDDLRQAKETAEDLARIKGEFLANMSHEIRTPMNAIIGTMHLVRNTSLSDKQLVYVETAEKSAKLLLRIINDILDFSKIEAGKMTMENGLFSIASAANEVIDVVSELADKKELDLSLKIEPAIPETVIGDSVRLKQVLLNLLNNAVKFTPKGSVQLNITLKEQNEQQTQILFKVIDTGIGLSEDERQKLFMPFSQADSSTTRKYGGTGLGLAISKSLVEMMQGNLSCTSLKDVGSTFLFTATFNLPQPDADDTTLKNELLVEDVEIPANLQGLPILLTEDNLINQLVATELLEAKGFKVDVANNGREAIEMLDKHAYGLVLMDIQMPEMDGLQAISLIRQDHRFIDLPVLAMTANAMGEDKNLCMVAGMNDHIAKPIDPSILYNAIIKWAKPIA